LAISARASASVKGAGRKWTCEVTVSSVIADKARASSAKSGVMRQWSVDRASKVSVMSRLLQKAHAVTGGWWCDDDHSPCPNTAAMVTGDAMPLLCKGAPIRLESERLVVGHRERT
jgi:hypothetical protein